MTIVTCGRCGAKNRVDERAAQTRQPVCGQCGAKLNTSSGAQPDTGRPLIITDATFAREVLQAGARPVLVDCWAAWCAPCRMIAPILDQLAAEANGRYLITKLNVDENKRTAAQYAIQGIPTLLVFKQGQLVDRLVGAHPKQTIAAKLAEHM
jgi:thioredoxin 2